MFIFQLASVITICFTFFFLALLFRQVPGGVASLGRYGGDYFGFALVGAAFSTYFDSALRTFGHGVRQAQITGTFEAMLATPLSLSVAVGGSGVYPLVFHTARVALFLGLGALLVPGGFAAANWSAALLVFIATVGSALVFGVFSAGFIVWFKQGDPVTGAFAGLSWLFAGILYPVEILPLPAQKIALALPMTHALEGLRLTLLSGATVQEVKGPLTTLTLIGVIGLPLSLMWFRLAVRRARVAGSLAKY